MDYNAVDGECEEKDYQSTERDADVEYEVPFPYVPVEGVHRGRWSFWDLRCVSGMSEQWIFWE